MDEFEREKQVHYLTALAFGEDKNSLNRLLEVFWQSDKEVQENFICFLLGTLDAHRTVTKDLIQDIKRLMDGG
jgi:hypothetical protein